MEFNHKPFNSMEVHILELTLTHKPEVSVVLFVAAAEFVRFQQSPPLLFPPPEGLTELPVCPVCLGWIWSFFNLPPERLDDAASGIVTIQCNHSFHCQCLSKWKGDNSCPVCRFCQNPDSESPLCAVCQTTESLWICLICGHVGCGRWRWELTDPQIRKRTRTRTLQTISSRLRTGTANIACLGLRGRWVSVHLL